MSNIIIFLLPNIWFCSLQYSAYAHVYRRLYKMYFFFSPFFKQPQFEFLYLGSYENWTALVLELMFHQLGTTLMTISAQQQDQTPTLATQAAF